MASYAPQISSRRTFAIISHPDAGKTTLTEKLLLYTGTIQSAGSVKGKQNSRHAVSDWMDIEKQRGISVTSSVLQFTYGGCCVNILDTPGHQDFSEDTYRTLMAADAAVMVIDGAKVVINGEQFDSWQDAHARYHHGWDREERWYEPCGYTVRGERFDSIDDARAKYGDEVGKSIPVRKHYLREFEKSWVKFPYPLMVIVVYLLLGILNGAWAMGLFLFLTIPLYYMVGHAIGRKRLAPLVSGAYPIAVVAWFCWMAFVLNQPHPAWVAFLTIPVVEWLVHSLSRWWRDRKRRKGDAENAPIDVDAQ